MKHLNSYNEWGAQKYQAVFAIFLIAVVFLFRENSNLLYPHILYLLMLLLGLNLAADYSLRLWPRKEWIAASVIVGNCAVITAILFYSGGPESNLWVLYLLPIYTVCLLLGAREVAWITAGAVSFNWSIYASVPQWSAVVWFELAIKGGLLILSAVGLWSVVSREKAAEKKLSVKRHEISELVGKIKSQESRLGQTSKLAELGELSSGVAHDLNAPLAVILATTEIFLSQPEDIHPTRVDMDRIARAAKLCKNIAANILAYIRKEEWTEAPCSVNDVIDSVLSLYGFTLLKRGISVERDFAPGLPPVTGSPVHLQRVILNLLNNAAQAMGQAGKIRISTRADAGAQRDKGVQIVVEDTGPGLSEQTLKKLFQRFHTTKAPGEGTGLGLSLCRDILIKHGGSITAENAPQGGARFIITLPSRRPHSQTGASRGVSRELSRI